MVVEPVGSIAFGSTTTCADPGSSVEANVTRKGCAFGGWDFMAKSTPPRVRSDLNRPDCEEERSVSCLTRSARDGRRSRYARVTAFWPLLHLRTSGSDGGSSQR